MKLTCKVRDISIYIYYFGLVVIQYKISNTPPSSRELDISHMKFAWLDYGWFNSYWIVGVQ